MMWAKEHFFALGIGFTVFVTLAVTTTVIIDSDANYIAQYELLADPKTHFRVELHDNDKLAVKSKDPSQNTREAPESKVIIDVQDVYRGVAQDNCPNFYNYLFADSEQTCNKDLWDEKCNKALKSMNSWWLNILTVVFGGAVGCLIIILSHYFQFDSDKKVSNVQLTDTKETQKSIYLAIMIISVAGIVFAALQLHYMTLVYKKDECFVNHYEKTFKADATKYTKFSTMSKDMPAPDSVMWGLICGLFAVSAIISTKEYFHDKPNKPKDETSDTGANMGMIRYIQM